MASGLNANVSSAPVFFLSAGFQLLYRIDAMTNIPMTGELAKRRKESAL
ncbi:MAG TPA: hypothetical protein VEE87_00360 [archaeon]|nr:hypothetical protein [archaeon]